jgi:hypothetical protein
MRFFNVYNLKSMYIHGEIEDFCKIIGMDEEEFYELGNHEEILIWDHHIEALKVAGIFKEWV